MKRSYHSVSHNFKLAVVAIFFALTLQRTIELFYFPDIEIMPDRVLLFLLFFIAVYLWAQELRDYYCLQNLYNDLLKAHDDLKQSQVDTISAIARIEEEKDADTKGHSDRVAKIALAIADEMGLSEEEKGALARAGILHDIGKIGIDDSILNKIGKLTDDEWKVIKDHPRKAVEILEPLRFLAAERKIIMNHHERYNGSGYPAGRKGEDIGRTALILAVADAFDAMNTKRPYRDALPRENIVSELKKARDTQLSARIVDLFLEILRKRPDLWEK